MGPLTKAFFIDTPSLIDSAWRHLDYTFNRERNYNYGHNPPIFDRPFWHKPPFWFFAITVFFVSYGPTWDGFCAIVPGGHTYAARQVLALAIVLGTLHLARVGVSALVDIIRHRLENVEKDYRENPLGSPNLPNNVRQQLTDREKTRRERWVWVIATFAVLILVGLGFGLAYYVHLPSDTKCGVEGWNAIAFARFLMCVAAVGVFAAIARDPKRRIEWLLGAQAAILALVALIQWRVLVPAVERSGLTATPVPEASDLPYRHVFEVLAPLIVIILAFAPWLAKWTFKHATDGIGGRFQELLKQQELFVNPPKPEADWGRILHAVVYGPAYHLLHLLLLPSLAALMAPAPWLYFWVSVTFLFSFFLLVWGNVSSRWQQLNTYIERWFLRGTPLLVSMLVILVGVLRVMQFDYVSTIIDASPFGFVFGLVLMNYVLFWLVEYWMSRAAAPQLLRLLGAGEDQIVTSYDPEFPHPQNGVRVVRQKRFLMSHDTGRFLVVGARGDLGPLAHPGPLSEPDSDPPVPAFQSYYLTELFARLGEGTGRLQNHEDVMEVNRRLGMYFFWMNSMIALIAAAFAGVFIYEEYWANNAIDPVVTVSPTPPAHPVDLAAALQKQETDGSMRPAIVVVGSGGGTRAALYTASVLNGLHGLGVDRDTVLLSGVSGGGAGLAYFAANYDTLTAPNAAKASDECKKGEWDCFNKRVTTPFIEDVLNGATEWRLFRTTALSQLLVESFQRYLFTDQQKLGSVDRVGLILNSAMVSHPAEDSDVLSATLDRSPECGEAERTYKLMGGGRLIFTNIKDVDVFSQAKSPVADVRLPYRVVQYDEVPLARAAALNANFPPVFPNARIRLEGTWPNGCTHRSYYVTDGGAEENLGLVSALYALENALANIPNGAHVRPIHVVIAEASAVSYDYRQDYGLSAAFGGSKERLTGGLTNELVRSIARRLCEIAGRQPCDPRAENDIRFHYLALPLAFRARGGFGTHWMYAKEYHLSDPRPRTTPWRNYLPTDWLRTGKATVDREQLEALWLMLHDPDPKRFCKAETFTQYQAPDSSDPPKKLSEAIKVQSWICGSPPGSEDRDLHLKKWEDFVAAMTPYRRP